MTYLLWDAVIGKFCEGLQMRNGSQSYNRHFIRSWEEGKKWKQWCELEFDVVQGWCHLEWIVGKEIDGEAWYGQIIPLSPAHKIFQWIRCCYARPLPLLFLFFTNTNGDQETSISYHRISHCIAYDWRINFEALLRTARRVLLNWCSPFPSSDSR